MLVFTSYEAAQARMINRVSVNERKMLGASASFHTSMSSGVRTHTGSKYQGIVAQPVLECKLLWVNNLSHTRV